MNRARPSCVTQQLGKDASGPVLEHFAVAQATVEKLGITIHKDVQQNGKGVTLFFIRQPKSAANWHVIAHLWISFHAQALNGYPLLLKTVRRPESRHDASFG